MAFPCAKRLWPTSPICDYDEDHRGWLYNKANLHGVDAFFNQDPIVNRLSQRLAEDALPGSRREMALKNYLKLNSNGFC
jgi:hypothetical protein